MPHLIRSARGTIVDMELIKIKQDLAMNAVNVETSNEFIDEQPKVVTNPTQKTPHMPNLGVSVGSQHTPDEFDEPDLADELPDEILRELEDKKKKAK